MQELGKFNLRITVIPNELEKYMGFTINNKLRFIDNFQFLSSSWSSFIKNLNNDDFNYVSQGFDKNKLDLPKQKRFYTNEYVTNFEKFKEKLPSEEKFFRPLTDKPKLFTKDMIMFLMFGVDLKWKH